MQNQHAFFTRQGGLIHGVPTGDQVGLLLLLGRSHSICCGLLKREGRVFPAIGCYKQTSVYLLVDLVTSQGLFTVNLLKGKLLTREIKCILAMILYNIMKCIIFNPEDYFKERCNIYNCQSIAERNSMFVIRIIY
jgi:hypothetical protein